MELQLKNIGMIKEANVKIDGLTVIAGENDTGKSTVGKALYILLKSLKSLSRIEQEETLETFIEYCTAWHYLLFKKEFFPQNSFLSVKYTSNDVYKIGIERVFIEGEDEKIGTTHKPISTYFSKEDDLSEKNTKDYISDILYSSKDKKEIIFIESPLVWNFTDFFRDIAQVESQMKIELDYPPLMKDLNFKLHIKNASDGLDIKKQMTDLMGGEFKKDEMGRYYFDKDGQKIELVNTATGIKTFGIFQVLSQNNYLNKDTVLILDEPEVHLHPKWQLEMAKVIVELVKNSVKVLVNSHSPYMIEALERYSEKAEVTADFYLAEDGVIDKVENNNAKTLAKIFHKLSAPYETFNQMDSEILKGG